MNPNGYIYKYIARILILTNFNNPNWQERSLEIWYEYYEYFSNKTTIVMINVGCILISLETGVVCRIAVSVVSLDVDGPIRRRRLDRKMILPMSYEWNFQLVPQNKILNKRWRRYLPFVLLDIRIYFFWVKKNR